MLDKLEQLLVNFGMARQYAGPVLSAALLAGALILAWIANILARKILHGLLTGIARRTSTTWDDIVVEQGVFKRVAHYAPALVLYFLLPLIFPGDSGILLFVQRLILVYMIGVTVLVLDVLLNSVHQIYQTYSISRSRPIRGYLQVVKIFLYAIGLALMITTLLNKSALGLLSGIGALSAVIMLVFKDSILGLVASIQLTANNLIQIGDWIEVPQFGADGDVLDITLQTVKVQNFDKTIVTFPIYALTSSSFKNWRGMSESGGRRIKRSLSIDLNTIRFLTEDEIAGLSRYRLIADYISTKGAEIREHNAQPENSEHFNGRRLTNVGTFRAYIAAYLAAHPQVSNEMTFLVRQLPPGPTGLPIEIYVFSKIKIWAAYESIQADIFDHLLAIAPEFGLRIYQQPGSHDFEQFAEGMVNHGQKTR